MSKSSRAAKPAPRKILVIAPHPDDETLGCGGAVLRHRQRGDEVAVVYLTSGELGLKHLARERAWAIREREAKRAAKILGIARQHFLRIGDWAVEAKAKTAVRALTPVLRAERADLIYVPHAQDAHPDHRAALPVLRAALQAGRLRPPEMRAYEVWTPMTNYDLVENISAVMPRKLRALRAHRSQLDEFDYERAIESLNAYRGELAAKVRYAEVFQSVPCR